MEVANLVISALSLVVNVMMLVKVNDISKKQSNNNKGDSNKSANQMVKGKKNTSTINQ